MITYNNEDYIPYKNAMELIEEKDKEIERLHSIIKEAREYIEESKASLPLRKDDFTCEIVYSDEVVLANELLEILDKVEKEDDIEFDVLKALNTDLDDDVAMG